MQVVVVRHHEEDSAGFIGAAFEARGARLSTILFPKEGQLPDLDGTAHIVLLGSTRSVYDEGEARAWIDEELAWLRRADAAGVPVLGICFGAQVLAAAFGGTVEHAGRQEIGWVTVDTANPELIPPGPWLEFHHDRCVPPPRPPCSRVTTWASRRTASAGISPSSSTPRSTATSSGCGWTPGAGRRSRRTARTRTGCSRRRSPRSPAPPPAGRLVASAQRIAAEARDPSGS